MEKMRDIQTIRHTENKYQNDTNNLCLISNYLKCKWIKLLNQKSEIERMDFFFLNHDPTICSVYKRLILDPRTQIS